MIGTQTKPRRRVRAAPCANSWRCTAETHWHPITPFRDRGEHTTLGSCKVGCGKGEHWHLFEAVE